MSASVIIDCDGCSRVEGSVDTIPDVTRRTPSALRRALAQLGWRQWWARYGRTRRKIDLCPECHARRVEKEREANPEGYV